MHLRAGWDETFLAQLIYLSIAIVVSLLTRAIHACYNRFIVASFLFLLDTSSPMSKLDPISFFSLKHHAFQVSPLPLSALSSVHIFLRPHYFQLIL